jgi:hypothetical protein
VGQWVFKNTNRVYYVQVESFGTTVEEARHNGFRKAIELAVGTIVLGEAESVNDRMIRNQVITYSGGYIDDFKIISQSGNTVVMDVWVSDSKIAKRLLAMGVSTTSTVNADGIRNDWDRRTAQETTDQRRREDGIKLAKAVLGDYPRMAFDVIPRGSRVVSAKGEPQFVLHYDIKFNKDWVSSLKEVLLKTRSGNGMISHLKGGGFTIAEPWFVTTTGWWSDMSPNLWIDTFRGRELSLRVDHGNNLYCFPLFALMDGKMFGWWTTTSGRAGTFPNGDDWRLNTGHTITVNGFVSRWPGQSKESFLNQITNSGNYIAKVVDKNECK